MVGRPGAYCCTMTSLIVSTIAFFVASYLLKRWADDMDFPKGVVRSVSIMAAALAISYGVAAVVDWLI